MIQAEGIFVGGGSDISAPIIGKDFNWTGGDGTYQVLEDGDGNWRIKFLSSGTFTPLRDMVIDAFLVGGGGGGSRGAGGGGYTNTARSIVLAANTPHSIEIGAGGVKTTNFSSVNGGKGGNTSAFLTTVEGGIGGRSTDSKSSGGGGGSGGGGYGAAGGIDGADGESTGTYVGGKGQGTTTREFGESTGDLYASGGSGVVGEATAGTDNTGDGGGHRKAGGSGIVIIRKHKEAAA